MIAKTKPLQMMIQRLGAMKILLLLVCSSFLSLAQAEGCVIGDCENGFGKKERGLLYSYEGEFKNGLFDGRGNFIQQSLPRTSHYIGEWEHNLPHGHGTYYSSNGDKYEGQFWEQRRHGYGVLTKADGRVLEGLWLDGRFRSQEELNKTSWIPLARKSGSQIDLLYNWTFYSRSTSKMLHRFDPGHSQQIQIKTLEQGDNHNDLIPYYANASCLGLKGTGLANIVTRPKKKRGAVRYPKIVTASCIDKEEWADEQIRVAREKEQRNKKPREEYRRLVEQYRLEEIARQERIEIARQERIEIEDRRKAERAKAKEERKKKQAAAALQAKAASLQAKKDECSSFGFDPQKPDHAECVMQLTIAEKARNQAAAYAEKSAEETEAYQAELRRVRAEQSAAYRRANAEAKRQREAQAATEKRQREAQAAADKRQREAQLLIDLGASISSGQFPGGSSSAPAFSDEPMPSSGRYQQCFYRVAGDRLSISIPRAEVCPPTRSFGSVTGYLTR